SLTSQVSGILPILNGGTNASSIGSHMLLSFNGTSIVATSTPTAAIYLATSTTLASQFPYASSTSFTASGTGFFGLGQFTQTSGTTTIASGQGFTIGTSQFVLQQGSGNVGIGTTTLSGKFSIQGSGTGSGQAIALTDSTGATTLTVRD